MGLFGTESVRLEGSPVHLAGERGMAVKIPSVNTFSPFNQLPSRNPGVILAVLAVLLLAATGSARAQEPPAVKAQASTAEGAAPAGPADEAMAWDRDFDLLLELKKEPTKAQREILTRRAALEQERRTLLEQLADLRSRLAAVEGTYTTEAILSEMLRQGVAGMPEAQENLRAWIERDEVRLKEIDARLLRLSAQGGD